METRVSRVLVTYRITPQISTEVSPAEVLLGRKPTSRLDLVVYPKIEREVRPGVLQQSTGPTSQFAVQLEDGQLLKRRQDHLIQRSPARSVHCCSRGPNRPNSNIWKLNSQKCIWKEHQRSQLNLCNHLPKASQRSVAPLGTDMPLDNWLILLLSDLLDYLDRELQASCLLSIYYNSCNGFHGLYLVGECGML